MTADSRYTLMLEMSEQQLTDKLEKMKTSQSPTDRLSSSGRALGQTKQTRGDLEAVSYTFWALVQIQTAF